MNELLFQNEPHDAKAQVVKILSKSWPLTAKQLHSKIAAEIGVKPLTYQAVHKALGELLDEGVVSKAPDGYSLSFDWIDGLSRFSDELKSSYSKAGSGMPAGQSVLFFDSTAEVDDFLVSFAQKVFDPKDKVLALQWCHFWIPLFLKRETYLRLKEVVSLSDSYAITPADTPLDRWCADYWRKNSKLKHRFGVKEATSTDTIVYKDFVVRVYYPLEFKRALDRVYNSAPKMSDFDVDSFYEAVFMKKAKVPVAIIRNQQLADQLKKETIALCGGRK